MMKTRRFRVQSKRSASSACPQVGPGSATQGRSTSWTQEGSGSGSGSSASGRWGSSRTRGYLCSETQGHSGSRTQVPKHAKVLVLKHEQVPVPEHQEVQVLEHEVIPSSKTVWGSCSRTHEIYIRFHILELEYRSTFFPWNVTFFNPGHRMIEEWNVLMFYAAASSSSPCTNTEVKQVDYWWICIFLHLCSHNPW